MQWISQKKTQTKTKMDDREKVKCFFSTQWFFNPQLKSAVPVLQMYNWKKIYCAIKKCLFFLLLS